MIPKEMVAAMAAELEATNAEIERLTALRDGLQKVIDNYRPQTSEPPQRGVAISSDSDKAPLVSRATSLSNVLGFRNALDAAIADILRGKEDGLHINAIFNKLSEHGIDVPGQTPTNNISSHMSNDKRHFERIGKGVWRLREKSPPTDVPIVNDEWAIIEASEPTNAEGQAAPEFDDELLDDVPF